MAFVFHHSEFARPIDRHLATHASRYFMTRVDLECIRVDVDLQCDERDVWFFRCLSLARTNHVLRAMLGHANSAHRMLKALSTEELLDMTVPYDDITMTVDGEELHVVYSIADSISSAFRRGIVGPEHVTLYEPDLPHFGLFYVYGCDRIEKEMPDTSLKITHLWRPIKASPNRVLAALRKP